MAPIRRYLRITKFSVLEVRIYLDDPSLASSWLLHPRHAVLPRVMEAIRPLVLPKLQEEKARERSKAKGRKRGVKDVVVEDDFEVSIFLTETSTRHSLLTKQKHFRSRDEGGIKSNSKKLTGEEHGPGTSSADAIALEDDDLRHILREESDEETPPLATILPFHEPDTSTETSVETSQHGQKRRRASTSSNEGLFIPSDSDSSARPKRPKAAQQEDKKKPMLNMSYDGFAIYGRVLCLVIRRRESGKGKGKAGLETNHAIMEDWIASTQMPVLEDD